MTDQGRPKVSLGMQQSTSVEQLQELVRELRGQLETTTEALQREREAAEAARVDPKTGTGTPRAFDEYLAELQPTSLTLTDRRRHRDPAMFRVAILLDIDHFGRFNKEYGQVAGDYVLSRFLKEFRRHVHLRTLDGIFRDGGDEFYVILLGTTAADIHEHFMSFSYEVEFDYIPKGEVDKQTTRVTVTVSGAITDFPRDESFVKVTKLRLSAGLLEAKNTHGTGKIHLLPVPSQAEQK